MSYNNSDNIFEDYLEYLNNQKLNKSSVMSYYFDFKIHLNENDLNLKKAFELSNINKFINNPTIKSSTKKRRRVSIKKILMFLDQKGYISDINYLIANIKSLNSVNEIELESQEILTEKEIQRLLDFNENYSNFLRDKSIIETIYTLGLRTDELINLKIKDIDINLKLLSFYRTSIKKTITLNCKYNSSLINYIIKERSKIPTASEYLFLSRNSDKFSRQSIWKIINKISRNSGIEVKVTPKILRKSFAVSLLKKGVPVSVLSDFFGVENMNFLLKENIDRNQYFDLMEYYKSNINEQ